MYCLYYFKKKKKVAAYKKNVGIDTEKQTGGKAGQEGVCSQKQKCLCVSGMEASKGTE